MRTPIGMGTRAPNQSCGLACTDQGHAPPPFQSSPVKYRRGILSSKDAVKQKEHRKTGDVDEITKPHYCCNPMWTGHRLVPLALLLTSAVLFQPGGPVAAQVAVTHTEGTVHGFLVIRSLEGVILADGELSQVPHGDRVTSHLMFHFKDGSIHEEIAVYSQHGNFRLLNDHLVQKGPTFKSPKDISINVS